VKEGGGLPALKSLDLSHCREVTDEGLRSVRNCTALSFLTTASR
jgi:hypothetical protein